MPLEENDPRYMTAEEVADMIHSTANIARQAILADDAAIKKPMKVAAVTMLKSAIKKVEESIDASIALDDDDE